MAKVSEGNGMKIEDLIRLNETHPEKAMTAAIAMIVIAREALELISNGVIFKKETIADIALKEMDELELP